MQKNIYELNNENLKNENKQQLYKLAKKINSTIPYSKITKKQLINIIINNDVSDKSFIKKGNDFTQEYIINLKNQINYFKNESEKFKNLYIKLLENNQKQINNNNKINNNNNNNINIKCNMVKSDNFKSEFIKKDFKNNKNSLDPWEKLDKIKNNETTLSERIKQNSLITYINSLNKNHIKNLGFNSRKDYFINQLNLKKSKISLNSVKLKKTNTYIK